jgi:hypothetical protein
MKFSVMSSLLYDNDISKMSYSIGIHFCPSLILAGEDGVYQYGEPYMDSLMALTAYTWPKLKINFTLLFMIGLTL